MNSIIQIIELLLLNSVVFYDFQLGINPDYGNQSIRFDYESQVIETSVDQNSTIEEVLKDYEGYLITLMRIGKVWTDGYSVSYDGSTLTIVSYVRAHKP